MPKRAHRLSGGAHHVMKKKMFPLLSDTVFLFFACALFFLCVFRFYLRSFWAAAGLGIAAGLAAAALFFVLRRALLRKKNAGLAEKDEVEKFRFHLAADRPENNVRLIAACLECRAAAAEKTADTAAEPKKAAPAAEQTSAETAEHTAAPKAPHIMGNEIYTENACTWVLFSFKDAGADDLAPALRAESENKCVYACGFTEEAKKLAAAFGVALKDAGDAHALAKEYGCLPEKLISPPAAAGGMRKKLSFRVRREAWRGYLFSGSFLLVFSLMTVFPVYYIVTGGLLLAAAVFVRLFGKPTQSK